MCRNKCKPGALQSISPRICLITRLESPQIMTRSFVCFASRSKLNSKPQYSASFTVESVAYSDAAATIVRSGSFHMVALYDPPFRLVRAYPSKLATKRRSCSFTVGGGMLMIYFGCFRGEIAIRTSSTSSRGVILVDRVPSISSSPFSHFLTSNVQFDSNAAYLFNLPFRPDDCTNQANVE